MSVVDKIVSVRLEDDKDALVIFCLLYTSDAADEL